MDETKQCPICHKNNNCGTHTNTENSICWCALETFPKEVFTEVPEEKFRKACICSSCLAAFKALSTT